MIDYCIRCIERFHVLSWKMKRYLLSRYEIINSDISVLKSIEEIENTQVKFILMPFDYKSKKILNFFKAIVEKSKKNEDMFVVFEDFDSQLLVNLGINPLFLKRLGRISTAILKFMGRCLINLKRS